MAHMEAQLIWGMWYEIDGTQSTEFVPYDLVGDLEEVLEKASGVKAEHDKWGKIIGWLIDAKSEPFNTPKELADYLDNALIYTVTLRPGFGARLSAPGYLDCTDWQVFETEKEARKHLKELEV